MSYILNTINYVVLKALSKYLNLYYFICMQINDTFIIGEEFLHSNTPNTTTCNH